MIITKNKSSKTLLNTSEIFSGKSHTLRILKTNLVYVIGLTKEIANKKVINYFFFFLTYFILLTYLDAFKARILRSIWEDHKYISKL